MKTYRKCIMGCRDGSKLHVFPKNPARRAEWFRILGVRKSAKNLYACSRHFGKEYIFGDRISIYAKPHRESFENNNFDTILFQNEFSDNQMVHNLTEVKTEIKEEIENDLLNIDGGINLDKKVEEENEGEGEEQADSFGKIENFEIRNRDTQGMIIKGRFIQTNKYLMVSYTPPKKCWLQVQMKRLYEQCKRQTQQLRLLNTEVRRLRAESEKFSKLLPKLRFFQRHNKFLYSQLKMYKTHIKTLKKRKNGNKNTCI